MNLWRQWVRPFAENRRLRWGCLVIGVLMGVPLLLDYQEALAVKDKEIAQARRDLARLNAILEEDYWPARSQEAALLLANLRERVWREESEGLMQAALRDWVSRILATQGLQVRNMSVRVDPPGEANHSGGVPLPVEMRVVRAEIELELNAPGLVAFLEELYRQPRLIWVERFSMHTQTQRDISLQIAAMFALGMKGPGS